MPFAQIHMLEGRTEEQKRAVIEKVTQALHEAVGAPRETIRILISEVPKTHWGIGGTSAKDLGRQAGYLFAGMGPSFRWDDGSGTTAPRLGLHAKPGVAAPESAV